MFNEKMVLCASNAYEKKYYLNDQFSNLPERVKQELQIMCVLFTEEVGGILILQYEEDGPDSEDTGCCRLFEFPDFRMELLPVQGIADLR